MLKFPLLTVTYVTVLIVGMFCQKFYGLGNFRGPLGLSQTDPQIDLTGYEVEVFLLAGQSNMEGAAHSEDYIPPPKDIADRIFIFDDSYSLQRAREPISKSGIGPSVAFAAEYLVNQNNDDLAVVLVNSARGGTNVKQWSPSSVDGELYTESVKRVLAASHLGQVKGVLFFQGENDAEGIDGDHPDDWDQYFCKIASELRADLGDSQLPIVFAQIGAGTSHNWLKVKEAQSRVNLSYASMIKTDDLPYGNGVHFTVPAYIEIGRRFGREMTELHGQTSETSWR